MRKQYFGRIFPKNTRKNSEKYDEKVKKARVIKQKRCYEKSLISIKKFIRIEQISEYD